VASVHTCDNESGRRSLARRRVRGLAFVTADIAQMLKMQHIFAYNGVVSPLVSDNISNIKCSSPSVKESEKLIPDRHPDSDRHQKLTTSRGSALAHAYRVWSTSVNACVILLTVRTTERQNDRTNNHITPPALAELSTLYRRLTVSDDSKYYSTPRWRTTVCMFSVAVTRSG